jgi:hypothetical protein
MTRTNPHIFGRKPLRTDGEFGQKVKKRKKEVYSKGIKGIKSEKQG